MAAGKRPFIRPDDLRQGTSRTIRSQVTRAALLDAGARVIGRYGYAEASIARITEVTGIALGTFYNYFASRQEFLDQILPNLSDEMLEFIRGKVAGVADPIEREEAQFRAFFAFLVERPEFFRVLHEAEQFAPQAYRIHHEKVEDGYLKWFKRLKSEGFLEQFCDDELKAVAQILMGARDYIAMLYSCSDGKKGSPPPEVVVTGYMKLITGGLFRPTP